MPRVTPVADVDDKQAKLKVEAEVLQQRAWEFLITVRDAAMSNVSIHGDLVTMCTKPRD